MSYRNIPIKSLNLNESLKNLLINKEINLLGDLLDLYNSGELLSMDGIGIGKYQKIKSFLEDNLDFLISNADSFFHANKMLVFVRDFDIKTFNISSRATNRLELLNIKYISEVYSFINSPNIDIDGLGKKTLDEMNQLILSLGPLYYEYFDEDVVERAKSKLDEYYNLFLESLANKESLSDNEKHHIQTELLYYLCCKENNQQYTEESFINDFLNSSFIVGLLIINYFSKNPFNSFSIEDVLLLFNCPVNKNVIEYQLSIMIIDELIENIGNNKYKLVLHSFFEIYNYISKSSPIDRKEAIRLKYEEGLTLEEIGSQFEVSRERIRQIIQKERQTFETIISKKQSCNYLKEDRYSYLFSTYLIPEDVFIDSCDIQAKEYYYLCETYSKGEEDISNVLYDENVTPSIKTRLLHNSQNSIIVLDGNIIPARKNCVVDYVLQKHCGTPVDIDEFVELYNKTLQINNIINQELYIVDDIYKRSLKNKFSINPKCLSSGKTFRYYDIYLNDYTDLLETIDLHRYSGLMISTKKFMNDYQYLMGMYDIRNEYELHNLLKKLLINNDEYFDIHFSRMPHIIVGEFDIQDYLMTKLFEYSPIDVNTLTKIINTETGINEDVIKGNYLSSINQFYAKEKYEIPINILDDDKIELLRSKLTDDLYLLTEFEEIFTNTFPYLDKSYISGHVINRLDFRLCSGYIINKNTTAEQYFKKLLQNSNCYDITKIRRKYTSLQVFYQAYYDLCSNYDIVEVSPNIIYSYIKLVEYGWTKEKIKIFCDKVINSVKSNECFTLHSLVFDGLIDIPKEHIVFYENLLRGDNRISFNEVKNRKLFFKGKKRVSLTLLIDNIIDKFEKISFDNIKEKITKQYGIDIDNSKFKILIQNCSKYCDFIEQVAYKDYITYQLTK